MANLIQGIGLCVTRLFIEFSYLERRHSYTRSLQEQNTQRKTKMDRNHPNTQAGGKRREKLTKIIFLNKLWKFNCEKIID
jgi:hypothetical protein